MKMVTQMMTSKKSAPKKDLNDLHKVTRQMRGIVSLIWVTMVAYIVYVEFYKDIISIL